ncbi:MAG: hypothetical protein SFV53_05445, partial [Rickettsiales bacterium]|nr:hypothetical protein [Rickettsiales bacterium]
MREAIRKFNRYFFPKRPTALQRNVDDLIKKICNKENNEDLRLQKYDELINLVKNKDVKDFSANNLLFLC